MLGYIWLNNWTLLTDRRRVVELNGGWYSKAEMP